MVRWHVGNCEKRGRVPLRELLCLASLIARQLWFEITNVIISASQLSKSFGGNVIFSNVSLQLNEGDRIAITGPSGIGKSTLLYVLASYDRPSSGVVLYHGKPLFDESSNLLAAYRFKVGFVFQEPTLMGDMTAIENIMLPFVPRVKGQIVDELRTKAVGLSEELGIQGILKHRANTLSTGEKRRVELVRALLKEPEVLLADEPTSNLDEESASIVVGSIRKQADVGVGVMFSLHRDQKLASIASSSIRMLDYK